MTALNHFDKLNGYSGGAVSDEPTLFQETHMTDSETIIPISSDSHVVEPTDMGDMVQFANRLTALVMRPIQMIHMPVPKERHDDAYFAPLKDLKLRPETTLALGLVHYTGGLEGTRLRIAAAQKYVKDFMIGTECGFGRRDPSTIPKLLDIHSEVAGIK